MSRTELQEVGKEIIEKHNELMHEHFSEYQSNKYFDGDAWEEAVKEICLLR